jgi:hypothetical protein
VFILPQSSNDPMGQSITFEHQGSFLRNGFLNVNLAKLRHVLLTKHDMQTPLLTYCGRSILKDAQNLSCRPGDTLVCYDTLGKEQGMFMEVSSNNNGVIDVDGGESTVIDLLSDSSDDNDVSSEFDEKASATSTDVINVNDISNDSKLAVLISMGFFAASAREALRINNGDTSAAAQQLLDGWTPSSSSSTQSPKRVKKRAKARTRMASIFDGHSGILRASHYINTAKEFDEDIAYMDLPRDGILLKQISVQPVEYYNALICQSEENNVGENSTSSSAQVTTILMRKDQEENCKKLEEEFEDSNISRREIREMFYLMGCNIETTRNALLFG